MEKKEISPVASVLILFALQIILVLPIVGKQIGIYVTPMYLMNYSYGFGSRLLIGTLYHAIAGNQVTRLSMYLFYMISFGITLLVSGIFMGTVIRKSPRKELLFLILLYWVSPIALKHLVADSENLGRLDLYMILVTVLGGFVCLTKWKTGIKIILLTVISCLGLFIHNVYLSIYFPVLLWFILYEMLREKRRFLTWLMFLLAAVAIGGTYLYFQFFAHLNYTDYQAFKEMLLEGTDFQIIDTSVEGVYFKTFLESTREYSILNVPDFIHHVYSFVLYLIVLSPWLVVLYYFLHSLLGKLPGKIRLWIRISYSLCILPFLVANDWDRWLTGILFCVILFILILTARGEKAALEVMGDFGKKLAGHKLLFLSLGVYLISLEYINTATLGGQNLKNILFFQNLIPFLILIGIFAYSIFMVLMKNETILADSGSFAQTYEWGKNAIQRRKGILTRCYGYSYILALFFVASDFDVLILQEGKRVEYISDPYLLIGFTLGTYLFLMTYFGAPLKKEGKINLLRILRYFAAVGGLLGWMTLRYDMIFSSAEKLVYEKGNYWIQWLLPFVISLMIVFDYSQMKRWKQVLIRYRFLLAGAFVGLAVYGVLLGYCSTFKDTNCEWNLRFYQLRQTLTILSTVPIVSVYLWRKLKKIEKT